SYDVANKLEHSRIEKCISFFLVGLLCSCGFLSCVSSCRTQRDKRWENSEDLYLCCCLAGYKLEARPGYKPSPPNGCGTPLLGFQVIDIGIPSLTKCCNQHDRCYDTCNRDKHDCDNEFQECLETICRRLQKMLGLNQSVQGKMATGLCSLEHATENVLQRNATMSVSYCSSCLFVCFLPCDA
uniref:Phospholipase A2 group XIIA n=1 Tax=Salmo trutta TaxID=8032 RepID=A0A673ZV11_SALTR